MWLLYYPKWQWLDCGRDGIISSSKTTEIKRSSTNNNISLTEPCDNKKFFLNLVNVVPRLKKSTIIIIKVKVLWLLLARSKPISLFII